MVILVKILTTSIDAPLFNPACVINCQDWRKCRAFCSQTGDNGVNRKMVKFDVTKVSPEAKSVSQEILKKYGFAKVQAVSAGAATFYVWVSCF